MNETKVRLLKAGITLFKKYGYDHVTIDDIAQECGLSKGAFYHHFSNKGELLGSYNSYMTEDTASIMQQLVIVSSAYKQLEMAFDYVYSSTTDNLGPDLVKELIVFDIQNSKKDAVFVTEGIENKGRYEKNYELLHQIIEKGQEEGSIKRGYKPKDLINAYVGTVFSSGVNWYTHSGTYNRKEELQTFFEIVFKP